MNIRPCRADGLAPPLAMAFALLALAFGSGAVGARLELYHEYPARYVSDAPRSWLHLVWFISWAALWAVLPVVLVYVGTVWAWRHHIRWTPGRTLLAGSIGAILLLTVLGPLFAGPDPFMYAPASALVLSGGPFIAGVGLLLLARHCIDTPAMPAVPGEALPCWTCGYDLRGQCECRCPECGTQYKVGELIRGLRMEE